MQTNNSSMPLVALVLGLAGLIPFIGLSLLAWLSPGVTLPAGTAPMVNSQTSTTLFALGTYGAVILSFLGGVRWGALLHDHERLQSYLPLTLSILPSLVAWTALLLAPSQLFIILIAGFIIQFLLDRQAARNNQYPEWFGRLRLILTVGATLSLVLGLIAQI